VLKTSVTSPPYDENSSAFYSTKVLNLPNKSISLRLAAVASLYSTSKAPHMSLAYLKMLAFLYFLLVAELMMSSSLVVQAYIEAIYAYN